MPPSEFRIASDRMAGFELGDVVTADDLAGCNVPALVEAGHVVPIIPAGPPARRPVDTAQEE